jgi:hypothetical protein
MRKILALLRLSFAGRVSGQTAYHPESQRAILLGGALTSNITTNATFALTNAMGSGAQSWQQIHPSETLPLSRKPWAGDYNQEHNEFFVFASQEILGSNNAIRFNDLRILANANGIAGSQLSAARAFPSPGSNAGQVTVRVIGGGFQARATVKLSGLGLGIVGTNTTVSNPSLLTATSDLTRAPGTRTCVVTSPDGTSAMHTGGFTIEEGGRPQIWLDIIVREKIRIGQEQTLYVTNGNRGTMDASNFGIWIAFPSFIGLNLNPNQKPSSFGKLNGNTYVAFDVVSPAGSSAPIPIILTDPLLGQQFQIQAWKEGR